jgi:hypothetical protein
VPAWARPRFATAVRYSSASFADAVEQVLAEKITNAQQVRRVTMSVIRYLLRSIGRPTPFGLFAGVAPVLVTDRARMAWGTDHRIMVRADTLWLDDVVERLETRPDVLVRLDVVLSDLAVERGDRIEMPRGPGRVTVRNTALMQLIRDQAAAPIRFGDLADKVAEAFPGVAPSKIHGVRPPITRRV